MTDNTLAVKYCIDPSIESDSVGVAEEIMVEMERNGDCMRVAINASEYRPIESDVIPVLVVHRSWWEDTDETKRASALNAYCKKDGDYTLLIVFTRAFNNFPGHSAWRKQHVDSDFPAERLCVLLDKEFVNVIPTMTKYLRETPPDKWSVGDFCQEPKYLTALSLLCQGFLAMHCGPDGKAEDGFAVEVPDTHGKIVDALREMKWGDGLKYSLDLRLNAAVRTGRDSLRNEASSSEFWAVFDETDTANLIKTIGREWEVLCGSEKFGDSFTYRLIKALPLKTGARIGEDFPILVAEVYIELATRLGRTE